VFYKNFWRIKTRLTQAQAIVPFFMFVIDEAS
jgi:hypothetical protein